MRAVPSPCWQETEPEWEVQQRRPLRVVLHGNGGHPCIAASPTAALRGKMRLLDKVRHVQQGATHMRSTSGSVLCMHVNTEHRLARWNRHA